MFLSKTLKIVFVSVCFFVLQSVAGVAQTIKRSDIFIRDPFILAVTENETYYMYSSKGSRDSSGKEFYSIMVYKSKDLQNWTGPFTVYQLTDSLAWWPSVKHIPWAPEVHRIQNKYYLFATFHHPDKTLSSDTAARNIHERGMAILIADKPHVPFRPITSEHTQTPQAWMTLAGTLFFESNKTYIVFCHEWLQIGDGTIKAVEMHKKFFICKR